MMTSQMYGRSFEASTEPQIPHRPMKPCPITAEQSLIPSSRLTSSSFIMPASASSTWQEERNLNCLLKKCLKTSSVNNDSINMSEVLSSIQKMKYKGAAGPDNIPPTFLKSLGSLALQELLSLFIALFHLPDFPQISRVTMIIPLLKAWKSPSDIASFQTISLTSSVMKFWNLPLPTGSTESNNLFSNSQAGFGKGRSCEDQILLIAQAIDVFQQWPMHAQFWHYWTSVRHMTLFGIRNSSSAW